jgi:hypothetical protein
MLVVAEHLRGDNGGRFLLDVEFYHSSPFTTRLIEIIHIPVPMKLEPGLSRIADFPR